MDGLARRDDSERGYSDTDSKNRTDSHVEDGQGLRRRLTAEIVLLRSCKNATTSGKTRDLTVFCHNNISNGRLEGKEDESESVTNKAV